MTPPLQEALHAWETLLGQAAISTGEQIATHLRADTSIATRKITAVLQIANAAQLPDVMKIANRHRCTVHPISTGRNWGYGSALPTDHNATLLDLSKLRRITDFDPELGVVTVEPGVTQKMLADFLAEQGSQYMVPVTGAGPHVSILANALERGYGVTPISDHFSALTDLEAVLADGSIYRSAMHEAGSAELARLFKWGIGPYVNGLFTQSGFGIVTRVSILLAKRPSNVTAFFFQLKHDELLEPTIGRIQKLLQTLPSIIGGVNLMNQHRTLAMMSQYPRSHELDEKGLIRPETIARMGRQYGVTPWTGFATLYGCSGVVNAAVREMKHALKGVATGIQALSPAKVKLLTWLAGNAPLVPDSARKRVKTLAGALELATGHPNETAAPLAYWRSGVKQPNSDSNPARDGCGLLWYAPLVPMRAGDVRKFVDFAKFTLLEHRLEPLVTLTSQSERLFDCTVPLAFNLEDRNASVSAHECLRKLIERGSTLGFYPYRLHVDTMDIHAKRHPISSQAITKLRAAWDPRDLLAPNRYR